MRCLQGQERFVLTFGVFGVLLFLVATAGLFILPGRKSRPNEAAEEKAFIAGYRIFSVLKVPLVPLAAFTILSAAISVGMLFVTLSPHLFEVFSTL